MIHLADRNETAVAVVVSFLFSIFRGGAPGLKSCGTSIPLTIRTGLARRLHRLEFAARSAAHGP